MTKSEGARATTRFVVIDGGAGTGKSTVCRILSQDMQVPYFNAGLIYRAIALGCLRHELEPSDLTKERLADEFAALEIRFIKLETRIFYVGEDVTDFLKTPVVSKSVPEVAVRPDLRTELTALQREIALHACENWGGLVADGRDATSVVWPDAPYRYLFVPETDGSLSDIESHRRNHADSHHSDFVNSREGVETIRTRSDNLEVVAEQILCQVRSLP